MPETAATLPPPADPDRIAEGVKVTWVRPEERSPRDINHELIWIIILPLTALTGLVYWKMGLPLPQCNFKMFTKLPCLTCGATREVQMIVDHGNFLGAFLLNPLVFLGYVFLGAYLLYAAIVLAFRLPRFRLQVAGRAAWRLRYAILMLALANWAYVIAMGQA